MNIHMNIHQLTLTRRIKTWQFVNLKRQFSLSCQLIFAKSAIPMMTCFMAGGLLTGCNDDSDTATTTLSTPPSLAASNPPPWMEILAPDAKDTFVADLSAVRVTPLNPYGEDQATLTVSKSGAKNLTLTATGEGCGNLSVSPHQMVGDTLSLTDQVGKAGQCDLTTIINFQDGHSETVKSFFVVTPTQLLMLSAVQVRGASYTPRSLSPPRLLVAETPAFDVAGPKTLVYGGTARLELILKNPQLINKVRNVRVGFRDTPGYFVQPAKLEAGKIVVELQVSQHFADLLRGGLRQDLKSVPITILIQLEDLAGLLSEIFEFVLTVIEVGTGDVQVSLSWDTETDVDLHVIEPGGGEIYFENKESPTGGRLNFDSNAGCPPEGDNNENIAWPTGPAPRGEYIVRVNYFNNCDGQSANYTVTIHYCGNIETYSGSFTPTEAHGGGKDAGTEIIRFSNHCQADYRVSGRATYEDLPVTDEGLLGIAKILPIRLATVQVRRQTDDVILTAGHTDEDGRFDLRFQNSGPPGYYVTVLAEQDNEQVKQRVVNGNDQVHSARSDGIIDEKQQPVKQDLRILAKQTDSAPAFNIFDQGLLAATLVRERHGNLPHRLTWVWENGIPQSCGSCYSPAHQTIYIGSEPTDRDEYDDVVILHEYGHFYADSGYTRVDPPNTGHHSSQQQIPPTFAWSEGAASFFAVWARGTPVYIDSNAYGVGNRLDYLQLDPRIPLHTNDNTPQGNLSEALLPGIMWQLAQLNQGGVFAGSHYLTTPSFQDRGFQGADLVDFLDGWFCRDFGERNEVKAVLDSYQFPYDFANVRSCL